MLNDSVQHMPEARRQILQNPPLSFRLGALVRRSWFGRQHYRRRWRQSCDVCLLSYPETGRAWLRVMLSRALQRHYALDDTAMALKPHRLSELNHEIPRIRLKYDDNPHLKTPHELVRRKSEYRDVRVILLVRDIRDLVISTYFQMTRREGLFQGDLDAFLKSKRGSVSTMIEYYNIWAANREVPRKFLLVRFEDLRADTSGGLRKILDFSGVRNLADTLIADAVNTGSYENMRRMDLRGPLGDMRLALGNRADSETIRAHRGNIGSYVDYLTPEQIEGLNERLRNELSPIYGYS